WRCSAPWPGWRRARASRSWGWRRPPCPIRGSWTTWRHSPDRRRPLTSRTMAGGQVELTGVPETMLWTLYYRAREARRSDSVLRVPRGVELVDRIDYPFEKRFGVAVEWQAQWQALRARRFDTEVRRFMRDHPGGAVVALGEGLETQFWRVDDGR